MSTLWPLAVLLGIALATPPAVAQEPHAHGHAEGDVHGELHFATSCAPKVQPVFNQAVAMLHSFGYEQARVAFLAITEEDPMCGMAHWGVGMSYFHQHWDQPTPAELVAGRAAAERAAQLGAETAREQAYIGAIGAFYRDADKLDHRTRTLAYAAAMEKLAAEFRDDAEASIFYALSLLAARSPTDATYANQKKAGEILSGLLAAHPQHPGIVHYTIHAFDYPELAKFALPAARVYAKIAPASPHALHMPSHIFTRLGLWDESIASNLEVARIAKEQTAKTHPGAVAFENLHANDYLVYAYLQLGADRKARQVLEEVATARRFDDPNFAVGYALVSVPARYALERRDWATAAALQPPSVDLRWENFIYARGNMPYANAIGAARLGDLARAREALNKLAELQTALAAQPPRGAYDWAGKVEAMRRAAAGWIAYAEGQKEEAVRLLTEAAKLEERVGKHAVTPGPILPAREQLGDLLLELQRPQEALAAYEAALADSPRRLNGLAGAARAAQLSGAREKARVYYDELMTLCRPGVCERPTAQSVGAFLNAP